jgi:hypothetical protein
MIKSIKIQTIKRSKIPKNYPHAEKNSNKRILRCRMLPDLRSGWLAGDSVHHGKKAPRDCMQQILPFNRPRK